MFSTHIEPHTEQRFAFRSGGTQRFRGLMGENMLNASSCFYLGCIFMMTGVIVLSVIIIVVCFDHFCIKITFNFTAIDLKGQVL